MYAQPAWIPTLYKCNLYGVPSSFPFICVIKRPLEIIDPLSNLINKVKGGSLIQVTHTHTIPSLAVQAGLSVCGGIRVFCTVCLKYMQVVGLDKRTIRWCRPPPSMYTDPNQQCKYGKTIKWQTNRECKEISNVVYKEYFLLTSISVVMWSLIFFSAQILARI